MGAAVTLEENESLAVRSEVLDIVIDGETARITATYQMENTTDEPWLPSRCSCRRIWSMPAYR